MQWPMSFNTTRNLQTIVVITITPYRMEVIKPPDSLVEYGCGNH